MCSLVASCVSQTGFKPFFFSLCSPALGFEPNIILLHCIGRVCLSFARYVPVGLFFNLDASVVSASTGSFLILGSEITE